MSHKGLHNYDVLNPASISRRTWIKTKKFTFIPVFHVSSTMRVDEHGWVADEHGWVAYGELTSH